MCKAKLSSSSSLLQITANQLEWTAGKCAENTEDWTAAGAAAAVGLVLPVLVVSEVHNESMKYPQGTVVMAYRITETLTGNVSDGLQNEQCGSRRSVCASLEAGLVLQAHTITLFRPLHVMLRKRMQHVPLASLRALNTASQARICMSTGCNREPTAPFWPCGCIRCP